ncbi:MAG: macro domain-containing protein [Pseudomonadota bacterium]
MSEPSIALSLRLVDLNPAVVDAWRIAFRASPEVRIYVGDIFEYARCCVVSPANSYGFMDGGIDAVYTKRFGNDLQLRLQDKIRRLDGQLLPVGASLLIETRDSTIPYMISAPTMETPGPVPSHNAFYAMAAVLNCWSKHSELLPEVYCPGLCTDVGHVEPAMAAEEMAKAYGKWKARRDG